MVAPLLWSDKFGYLVTHLLSRAIYNPGPADGRPWSGLVIKPFSERKRVRDDACAVKQQGGRGGGGGGEGGLVTGAPSSASALIAENPECVLAVSCSICIAGGVQKIFTTARLKGGGGGGGVEG